MAREALGHRLLVNPPKARDRRVYVHHFRCAEGALERVENAVTAQRVVAGRGITDRDNTDGPELLVNPNPTFEWVRLAQRIPVRINIDHVPNGVLISSGMTCTVVLKAPPRQWALSRALLE